MFRGPHLSSDWCLLIFRQNIIKKTTPPSHAFFFIYKLDRLVLGTRKKNFKWTIITVYRDEKVKKCKCKILIYSLPPLAEELFIGALVNLLPLVNDQDWGKHRSRQFDWLKGLLSRSFLSQNTTSPSLKLSLFLSSPWLNYIYHSVFICICLAYRIVGFVFTMYCTPSPMYCTPSPM